MNKFNIGDKVISKGYPYLGEEVGIVVGIDTREDVYGKYLVGFNSLDESEGFEYGCELYRNNSIYIIEPYEGYATWICENNLVKVEEECKEDEHEENIRMEFDKIREQKKEVIKDISEKVLEMTLEIKELEAEIEKIKKEWHL